ncbi:hypothetical protein HZA99_00690 [Candidatus Woesearchaeota archaeon]|nr:hypothetical protein [Candidatus Woesearchaeota archaeon]
MYDTKKKEKEQVDFDYKPYLDAELSSDKKIPYNNGRFNIVEVSPQYIANFVLGFTDCKGNIWIRRSGDPAIPYGMTHKDILVHEIEHNINPPWAEPDITKHEQKTRERVKSRCYCNYS